MRRKRQFGKHFWGTLVTSQDTRTWSAIIIKNERERIKKNNHKFVNLVFMLLPQLNCANLANAQKYLHILFDSFTSRRLASYHAPSVPLSQLQASCLMPIPIGNTSMSILGICLIYEVDCPTDSQLAPR